LVDQKLLNSLENWTSLHQLQHLMPHLVQRV